MLKLNSATGREDKQTKCNNAEHIFATGGAVAEWVRALAWNGDRTFPAGFDNPTSVKTFRFGTLAIPLTPLCQCLSEETLKAVGPFYLVSMPGEVKDPTSLHWNV